MALLVSRAVHSRSLTGYAGFPTQPTIALAGPGLAGYVGWWGYEGAGLLGWVTRVKWWCCLMGKEKEWTPRKGEE